MPGKLLHASLWVFAFFFASAAMVEAATLEGKVTTPDARPVSGAMVTAFSANRMRKETVFTNAEGRYLIVTGFDGELTVRARASRFADQSKTVTVGQIVPLVLKRLDHEFSCGDRGDDTLKFAQPALLKDKLADRSELRRIFKEVDENHGV